MSGKAKNPVKMADICFRTALKMSKYLYYRTLHSRAMELVQHSDTDKIPVYLNLIQWIEWLMRVLSEWLLWRIVFIETYGAIAAWVSVSELQYIIKHYFKSHYRLLCSHNHTITHPYHRTIVLSQPQCSTMFQLSICSFMIHMRHQQPHIKTKHRPYFGATVWHHYPLSHC